MKHSKSTTIDSSSKSSAKSPLIPLLVLVGILVVLLVITTIGWTRARNDQSETATLRQSLAMCENTNSLDAQTACFERLSELSNILDEYGQKARNSQTNTQ